MEKRDRMQTGFNGFDIIRNCMHAQTVQNNEEMTTLYH